MTKLKKKLALLAAVSLLSLPSVGFAAEDAENHTGIVDLELVTGSTTDTTTDTTDTVESSDTTDTSDSSSQNSDTGSSRDKLPATGGGTTGGATGSTTGSSKLPSTGETVNFFAAFAGTVLLGLSSLLLLKRRKGGDA